MFKRIILTLPILLGGTLLMAGPVIAERNTAPTSTTDSPTENTQKNVRDKDGGTLTPDEQTGDKKDIKITTKIRKAIVNDKSLSVNAQNIKVITSNRVVTLRGPVENADESKKIEKIAKNTRGVVRIDNQLEIKVP